ncbi:MAG: tetratricopeptide repeat protein [Desulfobacteraceae bacterium]
MTTSLKNIFKRHNKIFLGITILFFIICLVSGSVYASSADKIPVAAMMVLDKAGKLMAEKEYDRAIEILTSFQSRGKKILEPGKIGPKGYHHPMVYFFIGNCFLMKTDYTSAQKYYSRSLEGDPSFAGAWLNIARAYYELHNYSESAESFGNAYEKSDPKTPDSLYYCALGYLMAEKYEDSITVFQRLFKNHPEEITLKWKENYVRALTGDGHFREALPLIRELAEKLTGEEKTRWQEMLLYQYIQLDMADEALAYAKWLTRNECTRAKWWKALTNIHLSGGRYSDALAALTIYGYLTPFTMEEKKLYADLNLQLNIPEKAAAQYMKIMGEAPDETILRSLVIACQRQARYEEALELLCRYFPESENIDLILLKADILYSLKRYPEARETYQLAAKNKTRAAGRAWLMAGYAAWQCDDIKGSRTAFEMASRDSNQHNAAITAIKELDKIN